MVIIHDEVEYKMNKLVMLNEVRKEKKENNYQSKENDDKPIKDLYTLFKDKFYNLDIKEIDEDLKLKAKKIYNQKIIQILKE